jgi:hypothetical protein
MASSENLLPRPPSRGRSVPNAPPPEALFLSPTKQQPFQRPSSPRIILQPIAAERGPGTAGSAADRMYLSSIKQDIQSVCRCAEALQRDLDMQRRPACSLPAKSSLARRPLTPSAAADPGVAFRSDSIEASLSKILSSADASDGARARPLLSLFTPPAFLVHAPCFRFRRQARAQDPSAGADDADPGRLGQSRSCPDRQARGQ